MFIENIADPRLLERISRESGARIGGTLYSDSLSKPGSTADSYLGMMRQNALSMTAAILMSALVFAGSSQFIAVGLVAAQTPVAIIVLTTLIVNLRHMLYSATLLPYLKDLPQRWRIPLAFWLTDETFAVTVHRFQRSDSSPCKHWYQLGSSIAMYLNWQFWCFLGLVLGNRIPDAQSWGLDVAMPVTFIGMIIPFVKTIPVLVSVLTAGAASLLTLAMPYKLGIVVSAFAGIASGLLAQRIIDARREEQRR
jgi:4-azaleucine resistance transporter AzlC